MSIVIKGMDMPTSCSRCPCSNDESRFCRAAEEYVPMLGKPAFCPLVDVPDTNVEDMISRRSAIDALIEWYGCKPNDIESFEEIIEALPSAQPEQKTGKWIKLYPRAYKCSECKTWWEESEVDEIKQFIYCPKCGAKMEVENEHR